MRNITSFRVQKNVEIAKKLNEKKLARLNGSEAQFLHNYSELKGATRALTYSVTRLLYLTCVFLSANQITNIVALLNDDCQLIDIH